MHSRTHEEPLEYLQRVNKIISGDLEENQGKEVENYQAIRETLICRESLLWRRRGTLA
jgi:hypothetical protein